MFFSLVQFYIITKTYHGFRIQANADKNDTTMYSSHKIGIILSLQVWKKGGTFSLFLCRISFCYGTLTKPS